MTDNKQLLICSNCDWQGTQSDYDAILAKGCLACCPERDLKPMAAAQSQENGS